jgi:hypothetical protein
MVLEKNDAADTWFRKFYVNDYKNFGNFPAQLCLNRKTRFIADFDTFSFSQSKLDGTFRLRLLPFKFKK